MAKQIKTADELKMLFEGQLRAAHPEVINPEVVVVRTEDGDANWSVTHSGQTAVIEAAIERLLPQLQAHFELNRPGREDSKRA